jgi:hypothetical protein
MSGNNQKQRNVSSAVGLDADFAAVRGAVGLLDPGAVGAGKLWFDTTAGAVKVRDAANQSWVVLVAGVAAAAPARAVNTPHAANIVLTGSVANMTDADASLSLAITTRAGSSVLVCFSCLMASGNTTALVGLGLSVDGVDLAANNSLAGLTPATSAALSAGQGWSVLVTGLSAASHTFKIRYRNGSAGPGTIFGTTNGGLTKFSLLEVPV